MDEVMAVVVCFAGSYAPRGWAFCNGQILGISSNQVLFSLLGTTYGGDGIITFALPDLRGRTPVSAGQSPFRNYALGLSTGAESVTLDVSQIPSHTHDGNITLRLPANSGPGIDATVNSGFPSDFTGAYSISGNSTMQAPDYKNAAITNAGLGTPVITRSPYVVINHIICMQGIYPSRN
jgi:microcystin-dependent protein